MTNTGQTNFKPSDVRTFHTKIYDKRSNAFKLQLNVDLFILFIGWNDEISLQLKSARWRASRLENKLVRVWIEGGDKQMTRMKSQLVQLSTLIRRFRDLWLKSHIRRHLSQELFSCSPENTGKWLFFFFWS